ncbi:hypothetical protein ERJ70_05885 [Sediminibacillus dalangtanensis]|uniref:ABC transporter permease n=1 Tax=Sediminibacillus dalangtanensis TaxID=2729421 RepID=A0ABX7VTF5_9BACI|nr:hypothetical protein [Sediminibacillus dalangtanensis]QTM98870.1 hypothetical protein ERJ70_05885 [Sediminibacillus dalangtanensis]
MTGFENPWSVYRYVKRHRFRKKSKLYKLAFGVSFDVTISIYLGAFLLFGFFILYETLQESAERILQLQSFVTANYLNLMLIMLVRPVVTSYTRPGVLFSSAELKLSMLPFSKQQLWQYCIGEKMLKTTAFWTVLASLIAFITPLSFRFVMVTAGLIILMEVLVAVPQWRLYQKRFLMKLIASAGIVVIAAIVRMLNMFVGGSAWWMAALFVLLTGTNILLLKRATQSVNWSKVVQTNDLIIWNMWFINKISQMEIKPPPKQGWIQQLFTSRVNRKRFDYSDPVSIYRRLWKTYLLEQKEAVIRTIGSVLILLVLLGSRNDWLFGFGIALAIFLFVQMASSFFTGGFGNRLVYCLPWELKQWKRGFFFWFARAGLIICLVLTMCLLMLQEQLWWFPVQLWFYIGLTKRFFDYQLEIKMSVLAKTKRQMPVDQTLMVSLLFCLAANSIAYPFVSVIGMVMLGWKQKEYVLLAGKGGR